MKTSPALLTCFTLAACSASTPPEPRSGAPVTSAPATPAPVASSKAPEPAEPAAVSPFFVIGPLPSEMTLVGAGERGFLYSSRGIELQLVGDDVIQDPLLKRGLPDFAAQAEVSGMGGRWPDAAWIATIHAYERTGYTSLWGWDGKAWKKKSSTQPGFFIDSMQPWVGGRLLAVEQAGMMFDARFRILSGDQKVPLPKLSRAKPGESSTFCHTEMRVEGFATLPNGEVFVAGLRCDAQDGAVVIGVEHWAAGATRGTIESFPVVPTLEHNEQSGWGVQGFVAISPTSAFVSALNSEWQGGKERRAIPYFAHFDGQRWQSLPSPIPNGVRKMWSVGSVLYGLDEADGLWSGPATPGAAWSPVAIPAALRTDKAKVLAFWPRAEGDLWAVVKANNGPDGAGIYLLHTRPAKAPLPTIEAFERKEAELRLPGPPVEYCSTPFVLLYTLGRNAPADYDYPATREALKGQQSLAQGATFVEFSREGRRYFGARVPDFDIGKKLAKLVKTKVAGSTPELVCHDPVAARTLDIDLVTGKLK